MRFSSGLALIALLWLGSGGLAAATDAPVAPVGTVSQIEEMLIKAESLEPVNPEQGLALSQKARALAPDEITQLKADAITARLHRTITEYAQAHELSTRGLARATALNNRPLMAQFNYVLARTEWNLGNYPTAMEYYLTTLRLAEETGEQGLSFDAHSGISTLFRDFKQPEQAQFHLEQALRIANQLGDKVRLGDYYKVLGNNLFSRGNYRGSLEAHQRSLELHTEAGSERGIADAWQNLGYSNEYLGELPLALEQTRKSIEIYRRLGLRRQLVNAMRQSGRLLVKSQRPAEGIKELEATLALSIELHAPSLMAYSYRELARGYEAAGNLPAAYKAQQQLVAANEAVFNERSNQQLAVLNSRYIAERRELEINLLRRDQALKDAEIARSRAERYWLISLATCGIVALAAVISRQRLKLKTEKRILAETNIAKEAAEKANALKTRLLGITSHDLKNPLSAITGGLVELSEACPQEKPFIDLLLGESQHMADLIHDLLDHAALESRQLQLELDSFDLRKLVERIVATQQKRANQKQIALNFSFDPTLSGTTQGDAQRLQQVFTNLIDNAVKYTPSNGKVSVVMTGTPETITTRIEDSGVGLKAEDLAGLFAPFARLSAKPTAGESSTGLGLSICHELVALHHGRLFAESILGIGSVFTVELPRKQPAAAATT